MNLVRAKPLPITFVADSKVYIAVKRTLKKDTVSSTSSVQIESIHFFSSNSLCRFYLFCGGQDHHDAVEEDGDDDDEGEEGVDEDVDGDPADGGERRKEPHRVLGGEAKNVFAFAYHNEGLKEKRNSMHCVFI